jgi:hypothetical protein
MGSMSGRGGFGGGFEEGRGGGRGQFQGQQFQGQQSQGQQSQGQSRGQFRGKGPKDWTRSDERIREEVCELLSDADDIDASEITVKVENGEVILDGTVDSRWVKREAEDVIWRARGVKDVQNHLRVRSEKESSSTTREGGKEKEKEAGNGHSARPSASAMSSRSTTA